VRIPQINVDRGVFVLPDSVTDEQGVFIEPLACVIRAQKLIQIKPGETILIIGSGISGLLHLLVAKTFGAGKIIAIDINSDRLKFAKQFGADYVYDARDDIGTNLKVINEGRLADKILVCTGALSAFESSLNYVERGGTILSFATTEPGQDLALPLNTFWRNEIKIMPSYGNAPVDALEAIELINSERIPVEKLISHRIPLDDIQEGFSMTMKGLDSSGNPSLKVIVEIGDA
jgi:L-iditol 2-dehydrogenase